MPRLSRADVIDPAEVTVVHAISRTVRRCYLLGDDKLTGKNFDHRKLWIENLLRHFAAHFGIDLLGYSILSNHYHLILRTRPDVVDSWSDTEVATHWLQICPQRTGPEGGPVATPTDAEIDAIRNCPDRLAEIRCRLSSVSWWMRLLNQRVAQRANKEDDQRGRFWQDRYRAIRLIDEESLLACLVYVELNPIRAGISETLEESDYTSIKWRIVSELHKARSKSDSEPEEHDAFLAKLSLDESVGKPGITPSKTSKRCGDKGILPMQSREYFRLLDWTARRMVPGKRGATPLGLPPILQRLGLAPSVWIELVCNFEETFFHVAGRCDRVSQLRSNLTHRRFRIRAKATELLSVAA